MAPYSADVAAIGAGIGGLEAAIGVLKAGQHVNIMERAAMLGIIFAVLKALLLPWKTPHCWAVSMRRFATEPN